MSVGNYLNYILFSGYHSDLQNVIFRLLCKNTMEFIYNPRITHHHTLNYSVWDHKYELFSVGKSGECNYEL